MVESGQRESKGVNSKGLTLGASVGAGIAAFVVLWLITYGITHFETNTNSQQRQISQTNVIPESVMADETFNPSALPNRGVIILPEGKDMVSFPVSYSHTADFIGPGSRVDILAVLKIKNTLTAFPILVDMQILAVAQHNTSYETMQGVFPNMISVSLAVSQEEAMLLQMAKQRGCHLQLLKHPNKRIDAKYDIAKVKQLLMEDAK
jgi:Flp pilus assembly protein CpaB